MLSFAFVYAASTIGLFFVVLTSVIVYLAAKKIEEVDDDRKKKVLIAAIFFFTGYEVFSVKGFLKMIFPFFTVADNFTGCYLLFYLLIPFLNKLLHYQTFEL